MIIGLTGGIASGKSTVSRILQELGAQIIDTDQLARQVVAPGQPAYREIVATFGRQILQADGSLNRRALGRIVFNDAAARERLNAIIHPRIRELAAKQIEAWRQKDPEAVIVIEAPLLLEAGMDAQVDVIWVVTAPQALRLERIRRRDKLSREEAESRLRSQKAGEAERLKRATVVIDNSGDLQATRAAVLAAWQDLVGAEKK
ncbi:MAG: dephospho-CoA kinase [Clostridia bacterium]|nr:dephospho-CoA kinase [Clostridia bacterium]